MDREELRELLTSTADDLGCLSERARILIGELVDEMANDPRNATDEHVPHFRTLLMIEVLTAISPYEDGLAGLSRAVAAGEATGVVLAELTSRVTEQEARERLAAWGWRPDSV